MSKSVCWIIRFAVAIIALIIICAVIQPMIDAQIAQESIELAAEQMSIEGSQEYTVYHGIMQVCYWAARIAQIDKQRLEKWNGVLPQIVSDNAVIKDFVQ